MSAPNAFTSPRSRAKLIDEWIRRYIQSSGINGRDAMAQAVMMAISDFLAAREDTNHAIQNPTSTGKNRR